MAVTAGAAPFPDVIALPDGFQPEGIANGRGHTFYVGAIFTGAIYRGDLRTGAGSLLVPPQAGRMAAGIKVDNRNRIFVAGVFTGDAYVYDADTGASLATYRLGPPGESMVNDVVLANDAAWFTDSFRPVLYRVPIAANGALGDQGDVEEITVTGEFAFEPGFNLSGIEATPDGNALIAVQTNLGRLYRIDPRTGEADLIELAGGDGLVLDGRTLYVVQGELDRVAVVRLSPALDAGAIVGYLTHSELDVPATAAEHGDRLYTVNARFGVADPSTASYSVVQLRR
ncbi:MAG: superoxide dismutase [Actinomycetota bacterium]|nr:superoxide dismutase [Actinomycetota bacterium]